MSRWVEALQRLVETGLDLTTERPLDQTLQRLVDLATELAQARYGALGVLDETGQLGRFFVTGVGPETAQQIGRPPEAMGNVLGALLREGQVLRLKDLTQHPRFSGFPPHHPIGRSFLGVPIRYREQLLGDLYLMEKVGAEEFSEEDEALLQAFAAQAALAIQQSQHLAQLAQEHRIRTTLLEALHQLSAAPVDLGHFLPALVRVAVEACGAVSGNLILFDEAGGIRQLAIWDPTGALTAETLQVRPGGLSRQVLTTGQRVLLPDLAEEPPGRVNPALRQAGRSAAICVPLPGQPGVLWFHYATPHPFSQAELALLTAFADEAALALEKALLYDQLHQATIQLEAKVEARTRELQEAMRRAEEASRHKSAFLANMSHELRTPLNAILGFAQLLQEQTFGPLNEKQARYVQNILTSGRHLLALINDLLDLPKVEAGKLELRPEPFALQEALAAVLSEIRPQAEAKGLTLELHGAEALPPVTADPVRVKQILLNLLSNAVKFTPEGGRITVTARRVEEVGVELRVTDTGIGIKKEDLPKLFQPFTQLEPVYSKQFQGTGLGLALTKRLVELHGGEIRAESEGEGRGSTFTVRLPLVPPGGAVPAGRQGGLEPQRLRQGKSCPGGCFSVDRVTTSRRASSILRTWEPGQ